MNKRDVIKDINANYKVDSRLSAVRIIREYYEDRKGRADTNNKPYFGLKEANELVWANWKKIGNRLPGETIVDKVLSDYFN